MLRQPGMPLGMANVHYSMPVFSVFLTDLLDWLKASQPDSLQRLEGLLSSRG